MSDLTKSDKLKKIIEIVNFRKITSYYLSKKTGLTESGIIRLVKGEIKNPHKATIDVLYNYLFKSELLEKEPTLEKNNVSFSIEEVAIFVINNQDKFMEIKAFSNVIGLLARDRIIEIMREKENKS